MHNLPFFCGRMGTSMQNWLPDSPETTFEFTAQHVVIEVPEHTSDCPEPKTTVTIKKISLKNTSQYDEGRLRDWPGLKDWRFHGESVRGSLMRERFVSWDCTESLGMLRWKTTPYKQREAQPYKMATNWAQVTQKKQQQTHVYVSTIYFYI